MKYLATGATCFLISINFFDFITAQIPSSLVDNQWNPFANDNNNNDVNPFQLPQEIRDRFFQQQQEDNNSSSDLPLGPGLRHLKQSFMMLGKIVDHLSITKPKTAKKFLMRHGCYCFPSNAESNKIAGPRNNYHGPPLDELDALCKKLWISQKCLTQEDNCDVSASYPWFYDESGEMGELKCGKEDNSNWGEKDIPQVKCKMDNCELEKEFVLRIERLIEKGFDVDSNPDIVDIKDDEYDNFCVNPAPNNNPRDLNRQCCGYGLDRRLFNSFSKECCAEEIVDVGNC